MPAKEIRAVGKKWSRCYTNKNKAQNYFCVHRSDRIRSRTCTRTHSGSGSASAPAQIDLNNTDYTDATNWQLVQPALYRYIGAAATTVNLAPNATLVREWKTPELIPQTVKRVCEFLKSHTPR